MKPQSDRKNLCGWEEDLILEICRKKFYGANVVFSVQIILDLKKKELIYPN